MRHVIVHDLGLALACTTARAASADYVRRFQRFDPQIEWRDDCRAHIRFRARGLSMSGDVEVGATQLVLVFEVPLLLRPLQGRAVQIIERELGRWIGLARRGELPAGA